MHSLRKKWPYSELFWSLFSRIRTRITPNTDAFYAVIVIKPNVRYFRSLKILTIKGWFWFNFAKILQDHHFLLSEPKKIKLLADISFDSDFQKIVLLSLLLFPGACY